MQQCQKIRGVRWIRRDVKPNTGRKHGVHPGKVCEKIINLELPYILLIYKYQYKSYNHFEDVGGATWNKKNVDPNEDESWLHRNDAGPCISGFGMVIYFTESPQTYCLKLDIHWLMHQCPESPINFVSSCILVNSGQFMYSGVWLPFCKLMHKPFCDGVSFIACQLLYPVMLEDPSHEADKNSSI